MSEPLVDVGIPTHGRPRFREAVESVLAQTFVGWRLTISENGPEGPVIDRCSNHIWPIRGYGLYPLALRSAHRRTRRGPFRAVVLHMSACSTTTIGGIVIFFPAGYPFSNHTRRVGSYFRIATTSAEREKSFTGTRPTFTKDCNLGGPSSARCIARTSLLRRQC